MGKLIILRGVPASGKSTWAAKWVGEDDNRIRVSRDGIRLAAFCQLRDVDEMAVTRLQNVLLEDAMSENYDIVLDNTNLVARYVKIVLRIAKKHGYEVEFKDFEVSIAEALDRDYQRYSKVGPDVIYNYFDRFVQGSKLPPIPTIDDDVESKFTTYVPNKDLPTAYIFDIDGTLAHINPENPRDVYDASRAKEDLLDEAVFNILDMIVWSGVEVILMSGRVEAHREETEEWLEDKLIGYADLHMRAYGDMRKDSIVKHELFYEHVANNYNVLGVFDDRKQVVDMWREIGLKCFQVQDGDF